VDDRVIWLLQAVGIGLGGTFCMDIWAVFGRRVLGITGLNWCLVGRWVRGFADGRFASDNIVAQPERAGECALGWLTHYLVGVGLGVAFILVVGGAWLTEPHLWPAVLFGWVSVLLPFLVLQPALGMGIAGARTPHPHRLRMRSLLTHTVYGLGLFIAAQAIGLL